MVDEDVGSEGVVLSAIDQARGSLSIHELQVSLGRGPELEPLMYIHASNSSNSHLRPPSLHYPIFHSTD